MSIEMIIDKANAIKMFNKFNLNRKVTRTELSERDFLNWIFTVNVINSLEEDAYLLNNVPLERFEIAPEFKDFIVPAKVSFDSGVRFLNLKQGYEIGSEPEDRFGEVLGSDDFNTISDLMLSAFHKSNTNPLTVANCRKDVLYNNVSNRAMINGKVYDNNTQYFPLQIMFPMKHKYASLEASEMLYDYWTNILRDLSAR